MRHSTIRSTGRYLPGRFVHNDDLPEFPASSRHLISQKTGVFCRRQAGEQECTSDLAYQAAQACLNKIGFAPSRIEGIVVSTSSPDRMQPATATRVQHLLGATQSFAFAINSVCSGSTYGIAMADALIKAGQCRNVLFIAAEVYSKILNKKDFSTYPYFGDGTGAIFFHEADSGAGVLHSCLKTDGSGADTVCVPAGGSMMPFDRLTHPALVYFKMKGRAVFDFAVRRGVEIIRQLLDETRTAVDRIRCFICHQANIHIILKIAETLNVPAERFYINIFRYGNTASASVPIALDEAFEKQVISKGDLAVTVAFGGGLSWGANLIQI
jgi:3-oxoacyl-[acyl-carrier-protein] synthase III